MRTATHFALLLGLSFVVACGSGSSAGPEDPFLDWYQYEDTSSTPDTEKDTGMPEETYVPPSDASLAFVDQFGDDNKTCVEKQTCTLLVSFNAQRGLRVLYTEGGQPVEGVPIKYEVIEDPDHAGKMVVSTAYTNTQGISDADVKVMAAIQTSFKVRATVLGSNDVEPIYFIINAEPKVAAFLTVSFTYTGTKVFDGVMVYLFKSAAATQADLTCGEIDPLDMPTIDLQKGPVQVAQTIKFEQLPGLQDEMEQFYTICARGELADTTPIVYGCDDVSGHVQLTSSKHVSITLDDIPPTIVGEYDIQTELDLVSMLPDQVAGVVNFILDFFEKPSASLLMLVCTLENQTLQDLCGYVFNDPYSPSVYDLTMIGGIVLDIIDTVLATYVEEWTGTDIFGIGEDIRDMLKELRLISTFEILSEPDDDGYIAPEFTRGSWHTVSFRWTYGQNCPPNDDACGVTNFNIQAIGQDVIISQFPATLMYEVDYSLLTIGEHSLYIKYGQLINYILQHYVLPQVFGDGSDGLPVVDSYEKLIKSLLGGGKECLVPSPSQLGCCEAFTENVLNQAPGSVGSSVLSGACETLVVMGTAYLEAQLTQLDASTGNNLRLKTRDGMPCKLYDNNNDMKIDAWGKKEPKSERCVWDMEIEIFGLFTEVETNNFFGSEHQ